MEDFSTLKQPTGTWEASEEATDTPSLLVVILDANPASWYSLSKRIPVAKVLADINVFLNAHLAFHHDNRVAVLASQYNKVEYLYPKPETEETVPLLDPTKEANTYRKFREVDDFVLGGMRRLMNSTSSISKKTLMSGALSRALAYINQAQSQKYIRSRIVIFSLTGDVALQYIPTMNCIFCAQKKNIPISICNIAGGTLFLEQAADATGGIYLKVDNPKGLLQHLMMTLFPDQNLRKHLNTPNQANVDFRATCFCHKNVLDIGFVCSVCLSIYCEPRDFCSTCQTKFTSSTISKRKFS
ncbi:transcription factor TFIIH complex subunit Tfb4 [Schizosaccharomyces cryophilus OY26]|uniref:General transcription and DNA repair factor IIH subunit TFB4 n=1 Tax=Schizosaccharomyces cryophilus (strain OY26 / ATCC MYA-4695 / CBS 11777 / NBRC 106824 / NRRL Y48691) TaxID=653667 RepID=S9VT12_SCHCR|nr:transcription factor TFIIH complex subunit Tfb4 [Schizosaccharomyces cryophilus OY26]EPY49294.1 transcription factor TFIIH complex subunit Tfb4 [Schizosaccharomyces cryophilus OY26]